MCSVFMPAAFLPGTTGQLYKQFAITIVISVSVSGFVALTLTPAMCAVLLKHNPPPTTRLLRLVQPPGRPRHAARSAIAVDLRHQVRMVVALVLLARVHVLDLSPVQGAADELRAATRTRATRSRRSSCRRPRASRARRRSPNSADAIFKNIPGVQTRTVVTGYSLLDSGFKTNAGTIFVTFSDFDERYKNIDTAKKENARTILQTLLRGSRARSKARSSFRSRRRRFPASAPPAASSSGSRTRAPATPCALDGVMQDFLKKAREQPELTGLATTYPREHAAAARRRRSREDAAPGHSDPGRVQRDPGAVRLAHREPVQPVLPTSGG